MKTDKIAVTEGRLNQALENAMSPLFQKQNQTIQKMVENSQIQLGIMTKFYPYLDKAEVKLDSSKVVLCKLPHMFMGDLFDFFTPTGTETYCDKLHEPCVLPLVELRVAVMKTKDEKYFILTYYSPDEIQGLKPPSEGNMRISYISPTNEQYIEFGKNGLNIVSNKKMKQSYGEYEDNLTEVHYATQEDVEKATATTEASVLHDLLETTENYKLTGNDKYYFFRGDCWTINNNFESSASITSTQNSQAHDDLPGHVDNFKVTGTFRTKNDIVGIYWNSKDPIQHPYISYGEHTDYTNLILEFDYQMTGCKNFTDGVISVTMRKTDGSVYYFTMNRFITGNHFKMEFNNLYLVPGNTYINNRGQSITVHENTPVSPKDIKSIMFVIVPTNFVENNQTYTIMPNVNFTCTVSNITVSNGEICEEHLKLDPHKYRLCEGYDDFYDFNPYRICKEMRKLGYVNWVDLYIGASHFYEKSGTPNDTIQVVDEHGNPRFDHVRTEKMVLNKNVPLNRAFSAWLDCYARELKNNDTPNLVISVSMENLQCPQDWRQRDWNGNPALTGWIPSTFFYSPCHEEVAPYMQSVSQACLDIVVAHNMPPILQMGEAWWWWNENDKPVDPVTHEPIWDIYQPPCFYDAKTKEKFEAEHGWEMPIYSTVWKSNFDSETMYWLNQQICKYSDSLRAVVKSSRYQNGQYMALFFPPSVLDPDRVPKMMRQVNYLEGAYHPAKLDVLQLEDYDWVTGLPQSPETKERDKSHHPLVYTLGEALGFPKDRVHYFGGFVQYPKDATEYWREIIKSMDDALAVGYKEVFVWAGSQVRRDNKLIGYENYELVQDLLYK